MNSSIRANARAIAALAAAVLTICLIAANARAHDMGSGDTHPAPTGMSVSIKLKKDAMKGHNLFVTTKKFRWAPEHASGKHVKGEGHAHLMIDGVKVTRLYGSAYYLGDLKPGKHTVTVELNGNDHLPYVRGEKKLAASKAITVK